MGKGMRAPKNLGDAETPLGVGTWLTT